MRFLYLKDNFKDFIVITLEDIRKVDPHFHPQRLFEWQNKGYIIKVIKNHYIFSDEHVNEELLYFISNKIYTPSYISFETALSYYGLIPESTYKITAVTTRRTYKFHTQIADFNFRHIKSGLFFGYELKQVKNQTYKIAKPEKALLDYFYLNHYLDNIDAIMELRINKDVFSRLINQTVLTNYLDTINSKALNNRINKLLNFLQNA